MLRDCCNYKGTGIQCLGCQECCASCAETCDCCGTTSIESCLDACCPKRGVCNNRIHERSFCIFYTYSLSNLPILLHVKHAVLDNVVQ
jgi:hypothetical protein